MIHRLPVTEGEPCPYPLGEHTIPLLGLNGTHRIRVTAFSTQRLALVTYQEAKRELGHHRSQSAWRAAWVRRHDKTWCRRHPTASDADCARRFSEAWSQRDCWVIEFVFVEKGPRLLARKSGYTSARYNSIDPDVEAVDEATLTRYAAQELERRARVGLTAEERRRARKRARTASALGYE